MKKIIKAIEFAVKAHGRTPRKGTDVPYLIHPVGVARTLIDVGMPERCIIAGVLHDTIEDTKVTQKDIRREFGKQVADIVKGCSEPGHKDRSWEKRKSHTVNYLKKASNDIAVVACADKLNNLCSILEDYDRIGNKLWERFNRDKGSQIWYYTSLAETFKNRKTRNVKARRLFNRFVAKAKKLQYM